MKGMKSNGMKSEVKDYQRPAKVFSQKYNQSPTSYLERQDKIKGSEASKVKGQAYKGRY